MYTPPIRGQFFDLQVLLPQQNPNLPAIELVVNFLRTTREWASWVANIARAVGSPIESSSVTASLDFPNMAAGASADLTVTLSGVKAADPQAVVSIGLPTSWNSGLVFQGFVSNDDEVTVRCTNASTGGINPGALTLRIEARRYA